MIYNIKTVYICQLLFGIMDNKYYICYMNKLTLLLLSILFSNLTYSQVIEVSYQEQLAFAYVESESLINQWKNDEVIWDEYSYGYPPGEGRIVYTFDFNNMTITLADTINGEYKFRGEFEIIDIISTWDSETQHMSCVADTPMGDYFYEINTFETEERCLLMSCTNVYKKNIRKLPHLDWDVYNVGVVSTNHGEFKIKVIE